jgi:hypothetical protein
MRGEKRQARGRPCWFQLAGTPWHGIRILSHAVGKPSTHGRPDPKPKGEEQAGRPRQPKKEPGPDDPRGVGSPHSTQRR